MALASWMRDLTPSFWKTFFKWYSTVFGLMKSWEAISRLVSASAASRAIWSSRTVRSEADSTLRVLARSPVAANSTLARSAKAVAPIESNLSWALRNATRASVRRFLRRNHSPYRRCVRASSVRHRDFSNHSIALLNEDSV